MSCLHLIFFYTELIHSIKRALAHGSSFKFVPVNTCDSCLLKSRARHLFWCEWCCWVADNAAVALWNRARDNLFLICWQYYYSIKDISIGGRCVCHGHAQVCGGGRNQGNPNRSVIPFIHGRAINIWHCNIKLVYFFCSLTELSHLFFVQCAPLCINQQQNQAKLWQIQYQIVQIQSFAVMENDFIGLHTDITAVESSSSPFDCCLRCCKCLVKWLDVKGIKGCFDSLQPSGFWWAEQ